MSKRSELKSSRSFSFTLIELMAVLAILATLIALLLPSLSKAREAVYSTACRSNLRQLGIAFHLYSMDNSGYFPGHSYSGTSYWSISFLPYLGKSVADYSAGKVETYRCKSSRKIYTPQLDYGQNRYTFDKQISTGAYGLRRFAEVSNSNLVVMADRSPNVIIIYSITEVVKRHLNGSNYLFFDGRCQWMGPIPPSPQYWTVTGK